MAKSKKIAVATVAGLALSGKRLYDQYQASDNKYQGMLVAITGYDYINKTWTWEEAFATYAPTIAGHAISTYIGGPKGLNVNAKITGLPLLKL